MKEEDVGDCLGLSEAREVYNNQQLDILIFNMILNVLNLPYSGERIHMRNIIIIILKDAIVPFILHLQEEASSLSFLTFLVLVRMITLC